jgi:arabinose-5-phosphate isomerase
VVDAAGRLVGLLTDHDLRKALSRDGTDVARVRVADYMTASPLSVTPDMLVAEAVRLTETRSVSVLPVVERDGVLAGIVHLHDLLRAGVT